MTSHKKTKTPISTSAPRIITSIFLTRDSELICGLASASRLTRLGRTIFLFAVGATVAYAAFDIADEGLPTIVDMHMLDANILLPAGWLPSAAQWTGLNAITALYSKLTNTGSQAEIWPSLKPVMNQCLRCSGVPWVMA